MTYDANAAALYIKLREGEVQSTTELDPGTLLDLDSDGRLLGIEVLRPSRAWPLGAILDDYDVDQDDASMLTALFDVSASGRHVAFPPADQVVAAHVDAELLSA